MPILNLFFLGSPRIELDGVAVKVDTNKAIALLAYIGVTGESCRRDSLINLLWPDHTQTSARAALRQSLYVLNKSLPGDWLNVDRETISLNPDADIRLDVSQFHVLLGECRTHGHTETEVCSDCVKPLTETVGLYREDFLAGFTLNDSVNFDDWQFSETQSLRKRVVGALERLVAWHNSQEELDIAIRQTQRWLELDRADEEAHRQLMDLYTRGGGRTAALRQYEECVRVLKEELATSPQEATTGLYEAIKENVDYERTDYLRSVQVADAPSSDPVAPPSNNLPRQLTSFIGREKEIAEVKRLLSTTPLLTLTGVGGCGKTRLALEVASSLLSEYRDGVWLVGLAGLSDPQLIPQEIASTLGVREQDERSLVETLSDYLRSKGILLILDNCEHLIEACAEVAEVLLHACSNLKILATSREALGIGGETAWRVPSLSLPDSVGLGFESAQSIELSDLTKYEAVNLFIDRARDAQSDFTLTEGNAPVVAHICSRLDGIPLAIELAAARIKVLSVEEITSRLDDRFRLLTGGSRTALPRQQTLRSTIDWSYQLLLEEERVLLDRLSVFRGGWTLAAAEAICAGGGIEKFDVLDHLTSLVDKSLVVTEKASSAGEEIRETRYSLLETVRGYSGERLMESGEGAELHDRHLEWCLVLAERAQPEFTKPDQLKWLAKIEEDFDNLMAALEWSQGGEDAEAELRLAFALSGFWVVRSYLNEGRQLLEKALSRNGQTPVSIRAKALREAGHMAFFQGDDKRALDLGQESLTLFRELGDKGSIADALTLIRQVLSEQGSYDQALEIAEEVLALSREIGDKRTIAGTTGGMSGIAWDQGNYDRALELAEQSLSMFQKSGEKWMIAFALSGVALVARKLGDHDRALGLCEESLTLFRELGSKRNTSYPLRILGQVAQDQGDYERAASLHKEALTISWEGRIKGSIVRELEELAKVAIGLGDSRRGALLFGASEALRRALGRPLPPAYHEEYERSMAAGRADLGEEGFEAALEEGRAMSMEAATEYALKLENVRP